MKFHKEKKPDTVIKRNTELEAMLKHYSPPAVDRDIRRLQIEQLSRDILEMDYLPRQSFVTQLLTQFSSVSAWIWLVQAGILILIYYYVFRHNQLMVNLILFSLAPGLSLILVYELSKSFRANIWEMEAACRYNLAQIFFFRLCILLGGDFLILGGALIAYRMTDGLLWQFCLYALMPFFLTSALSLSALQRAGSRCSTALLVTVPLAAGFIIYCITPFMNSSLSAFMNVSPSRSVPVITLLSLTLLIYNARRVCTAMHYLNENRKDQNLWNLE